MKLHCNRSKLIGIFVVCGLVSTSTLALESDKNQPVNYTSVGGLKMQEQGNSRIVTMEQEVIVTRGSLQITGDKAIFEYNLTTDELLKVTVNGSPAHYQQQLDTSEDLVLGASETIYYTSNIETIIEFVGDASLRQPGTTTNCVAIKYFADTELFETTGPCSGVLSSPAN
jgi:lipopolysaccharide transport protein LptA